MGARNIIRVLAEAGLQAFPLDLGTNGVATFLPNLHNTHRFQIGNGTYDMDARIYLGAANKYVDFDVATSSLKFYNTNVTLGGGDLVLSSITANSIVLSGALNTTPNPDLTVNTLTVNNAAAVGTTTTLNTFSTKALSVIPTVDDTGVVNIGNPTQGLDLTWTIPGGKSIAFDRGDAKVYVTGVPIVSDAAVTINAAVTCNNTVTTLDLNTSNNTNVTTTLHATNLVIVPASDDPAGGALTVGDGTTDGDVKFWLGTASKTFELNRGTGVCSLTGISLNTDSPVVINSTLTTNSTITAASITANILNFNQPAIPTGNTYFALKGADHSAGNLTVNASHYGGYIRISGATDKTVTLPNPAGLEDVWFDLVNYTANSTTIQAVNATSQMLAVVGNPTINTAILNNWAEMVRITNIMGTKWLVSPYEGTTLTTA